MQTVLGNFETPLQLFFMTQAVLYAVEGEFSSNACRKLMTRKIKNPRHEKSAQMVLKLTNKLQMVEIEIDSRSSRIELLFPGFSFSPKKQR